MFLKKGVFIVFGISMLLAVPVRAAEAPPETSARAMIVYHAASGRVLAAKNPDEPMLVASTTKLMTALVAAEQGDLDRDVEILPQWTLAEGSSMYLRSGERYTLRELLQGLLLASGNDAALAVAETVGGSVERFAERMNRTAGELGLSHTHFSNPHGLDGEDHFSCARDLAVLMGRVMTEPELREILGMRTACIHGTLYLNHNKLLGRCEGVVGGKTGYTKAAGRCLVSCCRRDGLELICVTLSDPEDWTDHRALYDWAFSRYRAMDPGELDPLPAIPRIGAEEPAGVDWGAAPELCVARDARISAEIRLPRFVFRPVVPGTEAGKIRIAENEKTIAEFPLVWGGNRTDPTGFVGSMAI
ncbi:MAG: D-alanyl-D-alanine carboxypeptidase [Oscillospiraceae bacterium]|nr:D-alanyl-D-alanine carboxypeptidase [Oscillospiraceae bacterium]